jgi:hypothetical protein
MSEKEVRKLLVQKFEARHVDASLKHYLAAQQKYIEKDWDGVALKAGKFVEAVAKALVLHRGKKLPANARHFKAGVELKALESLGTYPDVVRIVIPKGCLFVYEVVNNRGGRHDAGEIDANEMDATVIIPLMSWIVAEMVRFCSVGGETGAAMALIDELTNKIYPYFEKIDGRSYIDIDKVSAADIALLLLYEAHPKRLSRQVLVDLIERHGAKASAANVAVHRLKNVVDDSESGWKLRGLGRRRAEALLKKLQATTRAR